MWGKKNEKQWLSGQFEVPTFIIESSDKSLAQYPAIEGDFSFLPEFKTAITKYTIINKVLWVSEEDLKKMKIDTSDYSWGHRNLSTASTKAIKL